jgi:hypothetical protein
MKLASFLIFISTTMLSAHLAWGQSVNVAGALGFRSMQIDTDIRGASTPSRTGFEAGILMNVPLINGIEVRSGFLYVQRYAQIKNTAQGIVDINYAYFDIPATLAYRFADTASVFAGADIAFNQSPQVECSSSPNCEASEVKSVIFPLQVGVEFRFLPQMGAELFYEYIPGDISANVQNMKTVGINLTFQFE